MSKKDLPISSSLEDYLEAIAEIVEKNGHAHAKDIAATLKVTMPSVTNALQALATRDLVEYRSHAPVVLTNHGAAKAAVIRRRHQTLKCFFAELLKLSAEEADEVSCKIEHVIGELVLSRLVALTEAVESREDCAGLRNFLNETMPQIQMKEDSGLISLDQLPREKSAVIVHVSESLRGIKKFADLGLVAGTLLTFEGRAPFGDLMRIRILGSLLSLRSSDARYIWVKVME